MSAMPHHDLGTGTIVGREKDKRIVIRVHLLQLGQKTADLLIHAVYLLDSHDRMRQLQLEDLRREIAIGIEECDRGETEPFTAETVRRIAVEGRKRLAEEAERLRAEADRLADNARQPIDETASAE